MDRISQLFLKEFKAYFVSPIAYIVIAIFLALAGWFFFLTFFLYGQDELRGFFTLLPFLCALIMPAVTMRLFSEEFQAGTYELLVTMPVTEQDVVLGKFLAATAFSAVMLLPTLSYAVTASLLGTLDWGPVAGGYLGGVLLCASFAAIGIFASSLTRNQITAFIIAMAVCLALVLLDKMLFFLPDSMLGFFQFLGADTHFQSIARGVLDSRDLLYFLSVCFVALSGTHVVLRERR